MDAIRAQGLSKHFRVLRKREGARTLGGFLARTYQTVQAVEDVTFSVPEGQIVGYLGPNGAGKSTTIKMLTGVLRPASGDAAILGMDPFRERLRCCGQIGVLFGQRSQLWWDIPLVETLIALRYVYALDAEAFRQQFDTLRDLLELDAFLHTPVRQLSLGQRMRGELAATLIHRPRVLFLDEPTIGVDVVGKAALRQFIREMNRSEGVTVMLTSHDLGDIESVCGRVLLLHRGRLVGDGTPGEIIQRFGARSVLFLQLPPDRPDLAAQVAPLVPAGCSMDARPNNGIAIGFDRSAITPPQILAHLTSVPIVDLRIEEASLADAFVKVYGQGQGA